MREVDGHSSQCCEPCVLKALKCGMPEIKKGAENFVVSFFVGSRVSRAVFRALVDVQKFWNCYPKSPRRGLAGGCRGVR